MAKILIVGSYAPSLANFRGDLIRQLVAKGHRVTAVAPEMTSDVARTLQALGATCEEIRMDRTGMDPVFELTSMWSLRKAIRRADPEVVIAYTVKPVGYTPIAGLGRHFRFFPLITGLGDIGQPPRTARHRFARGVAHALYRRAARRAERIVFQNNDNRNYFLEQRLLLAPEKAVVVNGSGVDTTHYSVRPLSKHPTFLLIARLLRDKGIYEYVEAARMVKMDCPDARFLLAGWMDRKEGSISEADLAEWQRSGLIEYLGVLSDVRPVIEEAKCFVLPSYHEGRPRTVLEAMAMGRPIVTTDAVGCRDTVRHGCNGLLVPVRDARSLPEAMLVLARDSKLASRMGAAGRQMAVTDYEVRKVTADMIDAMEL